VGGEMHLSLLVGDMLSVPIVFMLLLVLVRAGARLIVILLMLVGIGPQLVAFLMVMLQLHLPLHAGGWFLLLMLVDIVPRLVAMVLVLVMLLQVVLLLRVVDIELLLLVGG
jgi:hypothetical protein